MSEQEKLEFTQQSKELDELIESLIKYVKQKATEFMLPEAAKIIIDSIPSDDKLKASPDSAMFTYEQLRSLSDTAFRNHNQNIWDKIASYAYEKFIVIRNKQKYTAFPSEGNVVSPSDEGTIVKEALKLLRYYNTKIEKESFSEEDFQKTLAAIKALIKYPKIPKEILISLSTPQEREAWAAIVADKRYKQGTLPRNNDPKILYLVTATHIDTVLNCFINLNKISKEIVKAFVGQMAKEWDMKGQEYQTFLETVEKLLAEKAMQESSVAMDTSEDVAAHSGRERSASSGAAGEASEERPSGKGEKRKSPPVPSPDTLTAGSVATTAGSNSAAGSKDGDPPKKKLRS